MSNNNKTLVPEAKEALNRFKMEAAAEVGYIKTEDISRLIAFRNNPSDESWIGKKEA